jgi:UDP-2,3-diacylglucosamine hydrolase
MLQTFFIADVHLDREYPERKNMLLSFLNMLLIAGGDLYILGDFFDFWANNRTVFNDNHEVLSLLQKIAARGSKIYMIIGNRDLLLQQNALTPFGITFLGEEATITLDDKMVFLTHGYSLCTMDIRFHRYRKRVWPLYRFLDRILPGRIENYLARKFIITSKKVIYSQDQSCFQFSTAALTGCFNSGIDVIICGHAHRAAAETFDGKLFFTLPAWDRGSGGYLRYHQGTFSLHDVPACSQ